jgi:hypothetical protein
VRLRRIVAGFDAGACRRETLQAIAALAAEAQADVLGVFIEDTALLDVARLPFAAEVSYPSAVRRSRAASRTSSAAWSARPGSPSRCCASSSPPRGRYSFFRGRTRLADIRPTARG